MKYGKYLFRSICAATLVAAFYLSACSSDRSVVTESGSGNAPVNPPVNATAQATPQVQSTPAPAEAKASPTPNEILRQAQARPGVPVVVPESMRRPLNSEELQRALQQMPPEVRARILQGQPGLAKPTPKK